MVKVSVQIPTYNNAEFLLSTLDSVLSQTYKDYEVIVVDDGSTDNTKEILKPYMDKIRYFYQENQGISKARNKALQESRGKYVAFCDSDDQWLPNRLEVQVPLMENNPELAFVSANTLVMDQEGEVYTLWKKWTKNQDDLPALLNENFVYTLTVLVRKECILKTGLFDNELKCSNDFDMWARLAKRYRFQHLDIELAKYREHQSGISKDIGLALKNREKIFSKKDIMGDLSLTKKMFFRSKMYMRMAKICSENKNYMMASNCYFKSIYNYPIIGKHYWPDETIGKRFTLPYRVIKPYYLCFKQLIKGMLN